MPRRRDLVNDLLGEEGELGDPSFRARDADGARTGVGIRLILDDMGLDMFSEIFLFNSGLFEWSCNVGYVVA